VERGVVVADGVVVVVDNFAMVPIRPTGAVQLNFFLVREAEFDHQRATCALARRLHSFVGLETLGPICIDTEGSADLSEEGILQADGLPELPRSTTSTLTATLANGFAQCRGLQDIHLTLRCVHRASAKPASEELLPSIGACQNLRRLRLDVDCALQCGGALVGGVAKMLESLSAWKRLEHLGLGYLWWSEARDEAVEGLKSALLGFEGSVRSVAICCPQDPELGAMNVACDSVIAGAAQGLEELLIHEAWGHDGEGLNTLASCLGAIPWLNRVVLEGVLPESFQADRFAALARQGRMAVAANAKAELLYASDAGQASEVLW